MPAYDATQYDPPAAVAEVGLRESSSTSVKIVPNVRLLIDTGADVTLLPRSAVESMGMKPTATRYELIAFDGTRSFAESVELDMIFLGKAFRGRYLVTNEDRGILGRDVRASVAILLDGPRREWSEVKPR